MKRQGCRVAAAAILVGAAAVLSLTIEDAGKSSPHGFLSLAHAQPLRKLIARLRGQTIPDGIDKAEGRIEATRVDVSSKYPGQLSEISVEEGSRVTIGQVIGRDSSPEFEAHLRAAQSDLQPAQDAPAPARATEAPAPAAVAETPAPSAPAEATTSTSAEQETLPEFAPESIRQPVGAWASSETVAADPAHDLLQSNRQSGSRHRSDEMPALTNPAGAGRNRGVAP